jgi:two-component system sensor histidine kinase RpfC
MASKYTIFLSRVWRKLTPQRADMLGREQGQAILRVAVAAAVLVYYFIAHRAALDFGQGPPGWLIFLTIFLIFSMAIVIYAMRDKRSSVIRRVLSNAADVSAVTFLMISTGETGTPLFAIYLWVTLGNGFRFGLAAMAVSAVLSAMGFSVVMAMSDVWRAHTVLAAGIMSALIVLPAYAAHLIRQLHKARQRAEEASIAKSQFLARMSHELRTPLNGIQGTVDILRNSRRLATEERGLLDVLQESVDVSLRQIDSVLDFAKLEAGKLVLETTDFDLHRLVDTTVRMVSSGATEKRVRLFARISPEAPYGLVGDPHHLREILLNLLSNAVKFTEKGYVAMQVEPVSVRLNEVRLRFEIRDTGIGISPDALERIWESFSQEDTSTTRRYGGTGLGTTIARQLVELMGGRIAVSSIKGRGTIFWFELPFRRQLHPAETETTLPLGNVLLLSGSTETADRIRLLTQGGEGKLLAVGSVSEAISALARGIRLGNPWHVLLVDEASIIATPRMRGSDDLAARALEAKTPRYLLTDAPPDVERQCESAYAGVLPRQPSPELLASVIHASPHYDEKSQPPARVVRVEPWAWGRNTKVARRILVADDNRTNRLILQQILESAGYEADAVNDGEGALERLAMGRYKAAIIDLHMPGLDGVDLLRRYRLLHAGGKVPIVMLTADVTLDAKTECAEAGADAFLTKPVSAEALLSMLDRLIQESDVQALSARDERTPDTEPDADDDKVLDVSVLAELDRLCRDSVRLAAVVEAFEAEGETLLARIADAVGARSHPAFAEAVHGLKGNAANVGAVQLLRACRRVEGLGILEFRREGAGLVRELRERFVVAQQALRELAPPATTPGQTNPA